MLAFLKHFYCYVKKIFKKDNDRFDDPYLIL
jgi:hypothetical protein